MANLKARDADAASKFLKALGAGTETDPLIIEHLDAAAVARLELLNNQLTNIAEYTNSVETLLGNLKNQTDTLEPLLTTQISRLESILGNIPKNNDVSVTDTISTSNQNITIDITPGMSNWLVQTVGNFVGTIRAELSGDGTNFVPVNARQSLAGRIANNWSVPGMFRGCVAGGLKFRIIATSWTSGNAICTVRLSAGTSPTFQNSIVETRNLEQYYASVAGGNTAFSGSVGGITIPATGGNVGIITNPANSNVDLYIARVSVGTNKAGRFERWRTNVAPNITGSFLAMSNKGGGINTSIGKMYAPAAATISGGTLSKTIYLSANSSDATSEDGSSILRPGQSLYWWYRPDTNQEALATVDCTFWEQTPTT